MSKKAFNGGCYLSLSQMENICSFWEINPLTNRVRVRAPKTKEEHYPDYDTSEDETARMVAGLCNRALPRGSHKIAGKKRSREIVSEIRSSGESSGEESIADSGYVSEEPKIKSAKRIEPRSDKKRVRWAVVDDQPDETRKVKRKRSKSTQSKNKQVAKYRSRKTVDAHSSEEDERVDKVPIVKSTRRANQADGFTLSNSDYRKLRNSIYNSINRSSKRKGRNDYPKAVTSESGSSSNDDDDDDESIASAESFSDRELEYERKSAATRKHRPAARKTLAGRAARKERRELFEQPYAKFRKRRLQQRSPSESPGRVIAVRKSKSKSSDKFKSGQRGDSEQQRQRRVRTSVSEESGIESEGQSEEPVENLDDFWHQSRAY